MQLCQLTCLRFSVGALRLVWTMGCGCFRAYEWSCPSGCAPIHAYWWPVLSGSYQHRMESYGTLQRGCQRSLCLEKWQIRSAHAHQEVYGVTHLVEHLHCSFVILLHGRLLLSYSLVYLSISIQPCLPAFQLGPLPSAAQLLFGLFYLAPLPFSRPHQQVLPMLRCFWIVRFGIGMSIPYCSSRTNHFSKERDFFLLTVHSENQCLPSKNYCQFGELAFLSPQKHLLSSQFQISVI